MNGIIYKITNVVNNKVYIGKTSYSLEQRWKEHLEGITLSDRKHRPLYNAMVKYGIQNFTNELLEKCAIDQLSDRERYYIKSYNTFIGWPNCKGYNATIGGDGKPTLNREEIANVIINNISLTQSELADLCGCSRASIGNIIKEYNIPWVNLVNGQHHKDGISISQYDLEYNFIQSFETQYSAAKWLYLNNISPSIQAAKANISRVCNGKRKQAFGYIWVKNI